MARENKPMAGTIYGEALNELQAIERQVALLEQRTTTTLQQISPAVIADPLEGEAVIDHTDQHRLKWYSDGEWRSTCDCEEAIACDFGTYALNLDIGGQPSMQPSFAGTLSEVWTSMQIVIPAASHAAWSNFAYYTHIYAGPLFDFESSIGPLSPGIGIRNYAGNLLQWIYVINASADTDAANASNVVVLTTDHLEPDICHTVDMHITLDNVDVRIDGEEFVDVHPYDTPPGFSPPWGTFNSSFFFVGTGDAHSTGGDADLLYMDNIKFGSGGWGSSDLLSDDFETGTVNVVKWPNRFGGIGSSVGAAPVF